MNHLWAILQEAWSNISSQCLNKLTARMPRLSRAVIAANGLYFDESKYKCFLCINCLCNKICFRSLCCPLSVQNYHKLKKDSCQYCPKPHFLGRFQTFGGLVYIHTYVYMCACVYIYTHTHTYICTVCVCVYIYIYICFFFCILSYHMKLHKKKWFV